MNPIQSLLKPAIPITSVPVVKEKKPIATVHTRVQIFSQLRLLLKKLKWFICVVVNKQAINRSVMEHIISKISECIERKI